MVTNTDALAEALKKISSRVEHLIDPTVRPAQYVRELHRQWKIEGGKQGGKPRHSERFLEDKLKEQNTPIRSLTPKLNGKTVIKAHDGAVLVQYCLSNWPTKEGDGIKYINLLDQDETKIVSDFIEESIENSTHITMAVMTPIEFDETLPGRPVPEVITQQFYDSDAMVIVSPENTFITIKPKTELIGFRDLINQLWAIERSDHRPRPLIWVLDLGDLRFEELRARMKFLNVQALLTRFRALKLFDDRDSDKRWHWLQSRAVIILLNTVKNDEYDIFLNSIPQEIGHNRPKRPTFIAHNVSLSPTPSEWLPSIEFRALYGSDLSRIEQRSFSIFYKPSEECDLKYFAHSSFIVDKDKDRFEGRSLELPALSMRYANGFRAICAAAEHILGLNHQTGTHPTINGADAVQQLKYLSYEILTIPEFMSKY